MFSRRILFRIEHMLQPSTYTAMKRDGVENWVSYENGIAEISDIGPSDFPNIRNELAKNKMSYVFHRIDSINSDDVICLAAAYGFVTRSNRPINNDDFTWLLEKKA
jgi:hypothetical protein